eukprot:1172097-Pleurochrysis_carterae.AAC.4
MRLSWQLLRSNPRIAGYSPCKQARRGSDCARAIVRELRSTWCATCALRSFVVGDFLYLSNRVVGGDGIISALALAPDGSIAQKDARAFHVASTLGEVPRDFVFWRSGNETDEALQLIVANQACTATRSCMLLLPPDTRKSMLFLSSSLSALCPLLSSSPSPSLSLSLPLPLLSLFLSPCISLSPSPPPFPAALLLHHCFSDSPSPSLSLLSSLTKFSHRF